MPCFDWRDPEIALKVTFDRQEVIKFCLVSGTMFFLPHRHGTHNLNTQYPEAIFPPPPLWWKVFCNEPDNSGDAL